MAQQMCEADWREILDLAETAADMPHQIRSAFLERQALDRRAMGLAMELAEEFHLEAKIDRGSSIGRFEVVGELARGGTGQIFRAIDTDLGRPVALKVLNRDSLDGRDVSKCILREARAASALNHPNIVTIYEVIRSGSQVALVMEYVPGQSVRALMTGAQDPVQCRPIWIQSAKALEAAHAASVVHRDIKPENIMVRPDGHIKVLDFGLARALPVGEIESHSTANTMLGTPGYLSPEQCLAVGQGTASDIFSLGVLFYEMVAGRNPFARKSIFEMLQAIVNETPLPPSRWNPAVCQDTDALILAMLEKRSADRPNATQIIRSLESFECPHAIN